jgi:hypothetical protein
MGSPMGSPMGAGDDHLPPAADDVSDDAHHWSSSLGWDGRIGSGGQHAGRPPDDDAEWWFDEPVDRPLDGPVDETVDQPVDHRGAASSRPPNQEEAA